MQKLDIKLRQRYVTYRFLVISVLDLHLVSLGKSCRVSSAGRHVDVPADLCWFRPIYHGWYAC